MPNIDKHLDRVLTRLRKLIHARGFTQLEVQENLGWGRSYISQLLNKNKSMRIDQLHMILNVIDVKPEDFFCEIFPLSGPVTASRKRATRTRRAAPQRLTAELDGSTLGADLRRLNALADGLVSLLTEKGLITATDLAQAIKEAESDP